MKKHPYIIALVFFIFIVAVLVITFSFDDLTGIGAILNPLEFAFISVLAYLGGKYIKR